MKLSRDYLLGLGTGLVLSAALLLISTLSESAWMNQDQVVTPANENTQQTQNAILTQNTLPIDKPAQKNEVQSSSPTPESTPTPEITQTPNSGQVTASQQPVPEASQTVSNVTITIPEGASAETIAGILAEQGMITDKKTFLDRVKDQNLASKFHVGTYTMSVKLSIEDLLNILTK